METSVFLFQHSTDSLKKGYRLVFQGQRLAEPKLTAAQLHGTTGCTSNSSGKDRGHLADHVFLKSSSSLPIQSMTSPH